jgi:hypothetical protein
VSALRISEFKAQVRNTTGMAPAFLLAPIWSQVESFFVSNEKTLETWIELVKKWVQWTRTGRKLRLINTTAEEAAFDKFIANDDRLRSIWEGPDTERDMIADELSVIINKWLSPFEFRIDYPTHGSGATANELVGKNVTLKCVASLASDQKLEFLYKKLGAVRPEDLLHIPGYVRPESDKLSRAARFLTVDKNIDERRGIGPQEAALMWIQEGVRDWFYTNPFRSAYFRRHMPIFDRCVNQRHALSGSKDNNLATIDFSSASDSVSKHLVWRLFRGNLRWALLLARSTHFDRDPGRKFETYATMGDATTFPVETLVFAACVRLAIAKAVTKYHELGAKVPFNPGLWSVFGDDVVIPNDPYVLQYFYEIVRKIGFKLNEDKSFVYGPYRESCGIEAYLGFEIQPHYMRCKVDRLGSRFASLISLANAHYERGYKTSRQWFIYLLRHEYGDVPFTEATDDSARVYTPALRLDNVKTIWDKDIQEVRVLSRGVRSPLDDTQYFALNDTYAYYIHMHQVFKRTDQIADELFSPRYGRIGYLRMLEAKQSREPVYDERVTKLCRVAVPVRLLVRDTLQKV